MKLDCGQIHTWTDLVKAFLAQYDHVVNTTPDLVQYDHVVETTPDRMALMTIK